MPRRKTPDLVNRLPYLTTFSRELNGPTWGLNHSFPAGQQCYAAVEYTTVGTHITHAFRTRAYREPVFTRNNGLPAMVGEPLVKYRFPLDKLALLEKFTGAAPGTLTIPIP